VKKDVLKGLDLFENRLRNKKTIRWVFFIPIITIVLIYLVPIISQFLPSLNLFQFRSQFLLSLDLFQFDIGVCRWS
jgi:hypothetical protein